MEREDYFDPRGMRFLHWTRGYMSECMEHCVEQHDSRDMAMAEDVDVVVVY